ELIGRGNPLGEGMETLACRNPTQNCGDSNPEIRKLGGASVPLRCEMSSYGASTAQEGAMGNQAHLRREVATVTVPRRISRREAVRRLIAVARANALGPGAVTEQNIGIVAEFNLFPECGRSRSETRP